MDVIDAIRARRAVRSYLDRPIETETIKTLINLATDAPSAINKEPWAFVVERDRVFLKAISDRALAKLRTSADSKLLSHHMRELLAEPNFSIFYDAPVLIVICATSSDPQDARDCYLAGENLMLAATGLGLASCPIGFAWEVLREADVKDKLKIPASYEPVLPIVVGYAKSEMSKRPDRRQVEVLSWH